MTANSEQPPADPQSLSDTDLHVYEAIAALEQTGHPPTRREIAAASGLDDDTVFERLGFLVDRGVVLEARTRGEAAFTLATHDWSSVPDERGD
jgi:DNA-binding IclR family transcriptional regulator